MSQSSRLSLVVTPHKGIRYAFPQLSIKAGSLDYADKRAVADLKDKMTEFGELLEEHADLENRFILTALEERAPGSASHDEGDHEQLYFLQEKLMAKLDKILSPTVSPADAARLGYEFYQDLSMLHAAHLEHMMEEETVTQTLMWQHFTDAELMAIHGQIVSSIPPQMMLAWSQYILPALNPAEREEMLKGIQANAPAPFFEQIMSVAKSALAASDFEKLEESLMQHA
ncbi:MAG: hypothetical protein H6577_27250 [Lewinellaceae bacterium]|nr:hypothetical protein [Saprospiraceae bacterium]MCB9341841.1 hypothetical protein [Lewinellaceae bacterium]